MAKSVTKLVVLYSFMGTFTIDFMRYVSAIIGLEKHFVFSNMNMGTSAL